MPRSRCSLLWRSLPEEAMLQETHPQEQVWSAVMQCFISKAILLLASEGAEMLAQVHGRTRQPKRSFPDGKIALARDTHPNQTFKALKMQADMLIAVCMGHIDKTLDAL